jgi:hypothetical protein
MRLWSAHVCSIIMLGAIAGCAAEIGDRGVEFPAQCEGGSSRLMQGKITATIVGNGMVFINSDQRLAIPLESIAALTYGTDIRQRSLLRFVPFSDLSKHYVALTWIDGSTQVSREVEVVLKMSEDKSRQFVATLERLTGIQAVNADKRAALVRYTAR